MVVVMVVAAAAVVRDARRRQRWGDARRRNGGSLLAGVMAATAPNLHVEEGLHRVDHVADVVVGLPVAAPCASVVLLEGLPLLLVERGGGHRDAAAGSNPRGALHPAEVGRADGAANARKREAIRGGEQAEQPCRGGGHSPHAPPRSQLRRRGHRCRACRALPLPTSLLGAARTSSNNNNNFSSAHSRSRLSLLSWGQASW